MVGRGCVIIGCSNGDYRLQCWLKKVCIKHGNFHRQPPCDCRAPFKMFTFPKDEAPREIWRLLVNRKGEDGELWSPVLNSRVCSLHFIDGSPTPSHPYPTRQMGYEIPKLKIGRSPPKIRSSPPPSKKRKTKPTSSESCAGVKTEDEERLLHTIIETKVTVKTEPEENVAPTVTVIKPEATEAEDSVLHTVIKTEVFEAEDSELPTVIKTEVDETELTTEVVVKAEPEEYLLPSAIKTEITEVAVKTEAEENLLQTILDYMQPSLPDAGENYFVPDFVREETVQSCEEKCGQAKLRSESSSVKESIAAINQYQRLELACKSASWFVQTNKDKCEYDRLRSRISKIEALLSSKRIFRCDTSNLLLFCDNCRRQSKQKGVVKLLQSFDSVDVYCTSSFMKAWMPGTHCQVSSCVNGEFILDYWAQEICRKHGNRHDHPSCVCSPPFTLFPFSKDKKSTYIGMNQLDHRDVYGTLWSPLERSRICSVHFVDGLPTPAHPHPTVLMD